MTRIIRALVIASCLAAIPALVSASIPGGLLEWGTGVGTELLKQGFNLRDLQQDFEALSPDDKSSDPNFPRDRAHCRRPAPTTRTSASSAVSSRRCRICRKPATAWRSSGASTPLPSPSSGTRWRLATPWPGRPASAAWRGSHSA